MDTNQYVNAVAQTTFKAMRAAGETQLGLSKKTGIPRTTLARRFGGTSPFTVAELSAIATALGIPINALVIPKARRAA